MDVAVRNIPIIDIFAGPGGLGEGFATFQTDSQFNPFKIALSIEKDTTAHKTLELRSFYHQFSRDEVPREYYEYLKGSISKDHLFSLYPCESQKACERAWKAELGVTKHSLIDKKIKKVLGEAKNWVLIGGPPCQAYSYVGRSRMKGNADFEEDSRHFLYREYLRILRTHQPPVFVMENVKGILSSQVSDSKIFPKILRDLTRSTKNSYGYEIYSFVKTGSGKNFDPFDYVIEAENFKIPQKRHRVILLGIRKDIKVKPATLQASKTKPTVQDAIGDLPRIRSLLSKEPDNYETWVSILKSTISETYLNGHHTNKKLICVLEQSLKKASTKDTGNDRYYESSNLKISHWLQENQDWFIDENISGICNHGARSHMRSDLQRYFFASSYAKVFSTSPDLRKYPEALLPKHKNVADAISEGKFSDRFKVQLFQQPSTTILSHLSKDGHHFIHPDPSQCRSFTVREAARLQTFPDNYFFEGTRGQQYQQVGNAVPPLLAKQLAEVVYKVIKQLE